MTSPGRFDSGRTDTREPEKQMQTLDFVSTQNSMFVGNLRLRPQVRMDFLVNLDAFLRLVETRFFPYFEIARDTGLKVSKVYEEEDFMERRVLGDEETDRRFLTDLANLRRDIFEPFLSYLRVFQRDLALLFGDQYTEELEGTLSGLIFVLDNTQDIEGFFKKFLKQMKLLRKRFRRQAWFVEGGMPVQDAGILFETGEDVKRDVIDKAAVIVKLMGISQKEFVKEVLDSDSIAGIVDAVAKVGDLMIESDYYDRERFDAIVKAETLMGEALMGMGFMDEGRPSKSEDMVITMFDAFGEALRRYRSRAMADPDRQHLSNQFSRFVVLFRAAEEDIMSVLKKGSGSPDRVDRAKLRDTLDCIRSILPELAAIHGVKSHFRVDLLKHLRDDYLAADRSLRSLIDGVNGSDLQTKLPSLQGRITEFDTAFHELVMHGYFPQPTNIPDSANQDGLLGDADGPVIF